MDDVETGGKEWTRASFEYRTSVLTEIRKIAQKRKKPVKVILNMILSDYLKEKTQRIRKKRGSNSAVLYPCGLHGNINYVSYKIVKSLVKKRRKTVSEVYREELEHWVHDGGENKNT